MIFVNDDFVSVEMIQLSELNYAAIPRLETAEATL